MVDRVFQFLTKNSFSRLKVHTEQIRHGHRLRGKPPTVARTLKQRLESDFNKTDPAVSFKVDIGFSVPKVNGKMIDGWKAEQKTLRLDPATEKQSRHRQLPVDLDQIKEVWMKTLRPHHARRIAEHYGIYQDLFGDAYFAPVLSLDVNYETEGGTFVGVHTGNVIKPDEASKAPAVKYDTQPNSLWTLIMSTPDGSMENSNNEYCHWFLGNIPENKVEHGEEIIDYLRPIPSRGVGYYRYVFVLYKQTEHLDYTEYKKTLPCLQLRGRNWNTQEFYRKYQDCLTPAGLAFFQSDWDSTVTQVFHTVLGTNEPIFQYDFPKPYVKPQTWFPLRKAFNLYLDRYRDPKEIMKELLLRKLKDVDPFKGPKPPLKYPNAVPIDKDVPTWLRLEMKKERLGWGRINEMK